MHHSQNEQLITDFYTAFKAGDAEKMVACYHDSITFEDPTFGKLHGEQAKDMWRMLIERGGGGIDVTFDSIKADGEKGAAHWEAKYLFSATKRNVHNKIDASFKFKDGKIIEHIDRFNVWKWSSQALGAAGTFLGWTRLVKNKIKKTTREALAKYQTEKKA